MRFLAVNSLRVYYEEDGGDFGPPLVLCRRTELAAVNGPRGALKKEHRRKAEEPTRVKPTPTASPEQVDPFTEEEMGDLMRLDAAHNPVLADYWRNDSDDHLTSDS